MREIPLLMTDEMMRAVLSGRKTQTRRPISPQPVGDWCGAVMAGTYQWHDKATGQACMRTRPYEPPDMWGRSDILWLREAWRRTEERTGEPSWPEYEYRADYAGVRHTGKWHPSIHMPRLACRVTLPVLAVHVQRVQDIAEADTYTEGWTPETGLHPIAWYAVLWDDLYSRKGLGWARNPWVWVVEWAAYSKGTGR